MPSPSPGACDANIQPLNAQNRPGMMKYHILQEVTLLINRTWQIWRSQSKKIL